jgi:hypothetical protein
LKKGSSYTANENGKETERFDADTKAVAAAAVVVATGRYSSKITEARTVRRVTFVEQTMPPCLFVWLMKAEQVFLSLECLRRVMVRSRPSTVRLVVGVCGQVILVKSMTAGNDM